MSKSSQKNTLFSYFGKSPSQGTPKRNNDAVTSPSVDNRSPAGVNTTPVRRPALTPSNNETPKMRVKQGFSQTPKSAVKKGDHKLGSLVWSKLDGYPWWPSLVCLHPVEKVEKRPGKVHVQFFDDPPTRAWIDERMVKPYNGSKCFSDLGVANKPLDSNWDKSCKEADEAMDLTDEERLKLVIELLPSDEENSMAEDTPTPKARRQSKGPPPKRRRLLAPAEDSDEASGDEYKPEALSESEVEESLVEDEEEAEIAEEEEELDETPVKGRKRKLPASNKSLPRTPAHLKSSGSFDSPSLSKDTKGKLAAFKCKDTDGVVCDSQSEGRNFNHLSYDFLKPEKIRDAQRRRPDDPEYDPRTLYVPDHFKQNLTPAMRQWWEMKANHFDTVLFFKVGKFYELYHTDAVMAVKELGIILMKGDNAHCGFPERSFSKYSSQLIEKGYKVARVEQTETPDMMADRLKRMQRTTKFDKVVLRELCQITSIGTRTYNVIEGDDWSVEHRFLMAVWEKCSGEAAGAKVEFGIAFVDTSIGNFYLGHFKDDRYRSRFSTLLTRYNPVEIISAKRSVTSDTIQVWNTSCPGALHEHVSPNADCWDSGKTLRLLAEGDYFKVNDELDWPEGIRPLLDDGSTLGLTAKEDCELAIRALGALVWYLKQCQLDQELLSRRCFQIYEPIDQDKPEETEKNPFGSHMVLDGMTLRNLDVLINSSLGTVHGSLLERLNRCSTAFGQRMLRHWLCAPLVKPEAIDDRLDAVEHLRSDVTIVEDISKILKTLPDLERLVNKIHGQGSSLKARNHPDSRAIFFDGPLYGKKKIADFLATLEGFRTAQKVEQYFRDTTITSSLLRSSVKLESQSGTFPLMVKELEFFNNAFDWQLATKEGKMIPRPGVDREYDEALDTIRKVQADAEQYLVKQKSYFGVKVVYFGTDKKRYQLEVSDSAAKKVDNRYELQGQRKGFKRYYTKETRDLLRQMMEAEQQRDNALKDISRRIFEQFDQYHLIWERTINCLSTLDVLCALASYASDHKVCRPRIVSPAPGQQPYLRMVQGRHPAHSQLFVNNEFIPNDVEIGSPPADAMLESPDDAHSLTLVTGPNMGGKSTLMRQVGLCVILAQLGSFVPCDEFELTPVDRLFTRLGANDHILGGESTFFVELSETAAILKHATVHSLVLLDELGRGTATFDGTAIAYSVVDYLTRRRSRTLFSTHYHSLIHDFSGHPQVRLGHMACMVESKDGDDEEQVNKDVDPTEENIIFLYQFASGACPKSYGFHAARLAGLERDIISHGYQRAKEMERKMASVQLFRDLFQSGRSIRTESNWSCIA